MESRFFCGMISAGVSKFEVSVSEKLKS